MPDRFRQALVLVAFCFSQDWPRMLPQMVRGVVWNLFPVRHAGPQYNVVWLVVEELVGRPVLA